MSILHVLLLVLIHLLLCKPAVLQDVSNELGNEADDDIPDQEAGAVDEPENDADDDAAAFSDNDVNNVALREKRIKKLKKVKKTPVYVPVPTRKGKSKDKIISVVQGMYVPGGQQIYGKYRTVKSCAKACSKNPACFAADYDKWLHKCYVHGNVTACSRRSAHPALTHLSKIPCFSIDLPSSGGSRVILGTQMPYGMEQKGIDDLKTCIKKCVTAGGGLASSPLTIQTTPQLCLAINFDFSSHKCFFFPLIVDGTFNICSVTAVGSTTYKSQTSSKLLKANPFVVTIFLCPTGTPGAT